MKVYDMEVVPLYDENYFFYIAKVYDKLYVKYPSIIVQDFEDHYKNLEFPDFEVDLEVLPKEGWYQLKKTHERSRSFKDLWNEFLSHMKTNPEFYVVPESDKLVTEFLGDKMYDDVQVFAVKTKYQRS